MLLGAMASKPFMSSLSEDIFYNFINSMVEECKYCTDIMENKFNKELVMTKKDKDFWKFY